MKRRSVLAAAPCLLAAVAPAVVWAAAPQLAPPLPFAVGLVLPLSGPSASTGRQVEAGARLWLAQHGEVVAGRRIQLLVRDDGGVPEATRRLAQELVARDKVGVLAGFGLTPLALAAAPVASDAKIPQIVMAAAGSGVTEASPYIVRSSFTVPQITVSLADWAPKHGVRMVVTLVSDYAPGLEAERFFRNRFELSGGKLAAALRVPLRGADFAAAMQKAKDAKPDAVFVFVPAGQGAAVVRQFRDSGLASAGIRLIATGDVTEDDQLDAMGDAALGIVSAHHYSAAHPTAANKAFVAGFEKDNAGRRPNFMAVGGFDGMRLVYAALQATGGKGKGPALLDKMKGQLFESPRGPVLIDAQTRDIVQDVYLRKVERRDGQLWNAEFDVLRSVKDPGKGR